VRLGEVTVGRLSRLFVRFNSSKVRLGGPGRRDGIYYPFVSIPLRCDWEKFKTCFFMIDYKCFNSSKVRLGVSVLYSLRALNTCFNSSKVRLGATCQRFLGWYSIVSIPLRCDWEIPGTRFPDPICCFNSSKVRLGALLKSWNTFCRPCFNSSKVRLGGNFGVLPSLLSHRFQFL